MRTLAWLLLTSITAASQDVGLADRIVVLKSTRTLALMRGAQVLKQYKVALGGHPVGPNEREGDHKTPEGEYVIDSKERQSRFHLALDISYPSAADRELARKMGVDPGGAIMIHGLESKYAWIGAMHRLVDWTDGCIAPSRTQKSKKSFALCRSVLAWKSGRSFSAIRSSPRGTRRSIASC